MATGYLDITEGSGKKLAVGSFTEDGATKYVERNMLGVYSLTLPGTAQLDAQTSAQLSSAISVEGKGNIIIKTNMSATNTTGVFKILFYDVNDVLIGISEAYAIIYTGEADGGRYLGPFFVVNNSVIGAKTIKIRMTADAVNGNISIFVAGL